MLTVLFTRGIIWGKLFYRRGPQFSYLNSSLLVLVWRSNEKYLISIICQTFFPSSIHLIVHLIFVKTLQGWNYLWMGQLHIDISCPKPQTRKWLSRTWIQVVGSQSLLYHLSEYWSHIYLHRTKMPWNINGLQPVSTGMDGGQVVLCVAAHLPDLIVAKAQWHVIVFWLLFVLKRWRCTCPCHHKEPSFG